MSGFGGWTGRERRLALGLCALCTISSGLVAFELIAPGNQLDDAAATAHVVAPPSQTAPIASLPPLASLTAVTARPVFSPSRRPSKEADEATGEADSLILQGIVVSASDRFALIKHGQPVKTARVKEGQSVEGWTVRSISVDRVLIENAGIEHELKLNRKSASGGFQTRG